MEIASDDHIILQLIEQLIEGGVSSKLYKHVHFTSVLDIRFTNRGLVRTLKIVSYRNATSRKNLRKRVKINEGIGKV